MFLPLRDENPTTRVPFVNYCLIAANVAVFIGLWTQHNAGVSWLEAGYGLVPRRLTGDPLGEAFTLISSQFMHGGWLHLGANMLFLHIFGDNLEEALGHRRYLSFYLLGGVAAGLTHYATDTASMLPMIGASGSIAAVIGGYLLLFPRAPVVVLNLALPLWFLGFVLVIPAWWVAAEFFLVNALPLFVDASGALARALPWLGLSLSGEGVAVFAHLGGLLAGLALIKPMLGGAVVEPRRFHGFRVSSKEPVAPGGGARWRRRPRQRRPEDDD
jgi:membrane associated rhomboid family serine protease